MRSISYQSLRRLAYFEAIAQAGSIRGAAQRLSLSVPVLSAALSELEEELNVTLAVRSTRSLELTDAGQRVYHDASLMMEAAFSALDHTDENQHLSGTVGVTMVAELALHFPDFFGVWKLVLPIEREKGKVQPQIDRRRPAVSSPLNVDCIDNLASDSAKVAATPFEA